jgi:mutator protein MutT
VIIVVAAIIERHGQYLVTRRGDRVHLAGKWEFPGGKVDHGETHVQALTREIREELDADIGVGDLVLHTTHAYQDVEVSLHFYACTLFGNPKPLLGQEMRWVARDELALLDFPEADAELIRQLTTSAAH